MGPQEQAKAGSWDVSVAVGPEPAGLMLEPRQSMVQGVMTRAGGSRPP